MVACAEGTGSVLGPPVDRETPALGCGRRDKGQTIGLTYMAKIREVVHVTMQRRGQLSSENTQQVMKSAGGANAVKYDDHKNQFLYEEIQHLQKQSRPSITLDAVADCRGTGPRSGLAVLLR